MKKLIMIRAVSAYVELRYINPDHIIQIFSDPDGTFWIQLSNKDQYEISKESYDRIIAYFNS